MKDKRTAAGLLVMIMFSIIIGIAILQSEETVTKEFSAEEISIQEAPTSIQKEINAFLEDRGVHFYRQENSDTVYALLTAGTIVGRTLTIEPSSIEEGIYFSVHFSESSNTTESLQYKVYKTQAPSVAGDDYLLQNPYLKVGAKGLNSGYLQQMTQGYYVLPFMDTDGLNRVYGTSQNAKDISDGLYSFTYELTETGAKLLSATPLDAYLLECTVTSFMDGPKPSAAIMFGAHRLKADLIVTDENILTKLRETDFEKLNLQAECAVSFANQLIMTGLQVLNFSEK